MAEKFQFVGLELLSENEKSVCTSIIEDSYLKLKRKLKNDISLVVHFKIYGKESRTKKFSINIKLISPAKVFESSTADWDLAKALHKALNKLMSEIEHTFHVK